jgi:hypothetical protein
MMRGPEKPTTISGEMRETEETLKAGECAMRQSVWYSSLSRAEGTQPSPSLPLLARRMQQQLVEDRHHQLAHRFTGKSQTNKTKQNKATS